MRNTSGKIMETASKIKKIALLGDYLPRKCGIAMFTSDLLTSVAADHHLRRPCYVVDERDGILQIPKTFLYRSGQIRRGRTDETSPFRSCKR